MSDAPFTLTVVPPAQLPACRDALRVQGADIREVSLRGIRSKAALLARLASRLALPEGTGHNWDSLADALRDVFPPDADSVQVLVVQHTRALYEAATADYHTFMEILEETGAFYRQHGQRLTILTERL